MGDNPVLAEVAVETVAGMPVEVRDQLERLADRNGWTPAMIVTGGLLKDTLAGELRVRHAKP